MVHNEALPAGSSRSGSTTLAITAVSRLFVSMANGNAPRQIASTRGGTPGGGDTQFETARDRPASARVSDTGLPSRIGPDCGGRRVLARRLHQGHSGSRADPTEPTRAASRGQRPSDRDPRRRSRRRRGSSDVRRRPRPQRGRRRGGSGDFQPATQSRFGAHSIVALPLQRLRRS